MILSGQNFRSLADQTGNFSYVFQAQPNSYSSVSEFGLTGDYSINYTLRSGKVLDRNGSFVDGYLVNKPCIISGNVFESSHEFFVNGRVKRTNEILPTGKIKTFYSNHNISTDFNFNFYGETPDFTIITQPSIFTSGVPLTGQIVNNNPFISFEFFSGRVVNSTNPVIISGVPTGSITGTENFYLIPQDSNVDSGNVDLRFFTNFGTVDYSYSLTGEGQQFIPDTNFYLFLQPAENQFNGEDSSSTVKVSYSNPEGSDIQISLDYISGETGKIFEERLFNREFKTQLNSFISGVQFLSSSQTGIISGLNASGLFQTGLGSGILTGQGFATGEINYNYELTLTGLGSGTIDAQVILATVSNERFTGFVPFGVTAIPKTINNVSGSGVLNGINLSGLMETAVGELIIDPLNYLPTGQINLQETQYVTELLVEYLAYTGLISKEYSLIASGFAGPIIESGVFDQNFIANVKKGIYYFEKEYDTLVTGFDNVFIADTLNEIIVGEKPSATGLSLNLSGTLNTSLLGSCIKNSPNYEVGGSYSPDILKIGQAKAILSLSKFNPSFTGSLIKAQSQSEEKNIYFYQNYLNTANLIQFANNGDVFINEWRDQSIPSKSLQISGEVSGEQFAIYDSKPRVLTGDKVFRSGIRFESPVSINLDEDEYVFCGFITGSGFFNEYSGSQDYAIVRSSIDYSGSGEFTIQEGLSFEVEGDGGIVDFLNQYSGYIDSSIKTGAQNISDFLLYESSNPEILTYLESFYS